MKDSPIIKLIVRLARPHLFISLLVFASIVVAGGRVNNAWESLISGKLFTTVSAVPPAYAAAAETEGTKEAQTTPATDDNDNQEIDRSEERAEGRANIAEDNQLLQQLSARRRQLDRREEELKTREAVLQVAEQRVTQKMGEMENLRNQIQTIVNQANSTKQAQMDNLVKIYETMKPKEAARIFETMELPILLSVVQKMKAQRTAAVLAEMPPEKAKEITVAISQQDKWQ